MSLAMSKDEREAFLADVHVGVISIAAEHRAPLTVPVWYSYEPGSVIRFVTGGASRKAALIRQAGRLSLCAQTEVAPYQYVSIEGPAVIGTPDFERDIRGIAYRYLGEQRGAAYLQMTAGERQNAILVSVTPKRWFSVDYRKMGA